MDNSSRGPASPGYGKVPRVRRIVAVGIGAILAACVAGTFLCAARYLQKWGDGSSPKPTEDPWLALQDQQLLRTGLRKLDDRAELIWKDIDVLQKEIDAYQRLYNDLDVSEEGRRLMKDEWVVRYFNDKWGEPLPYEEVARHCRVRLNELMFTVKEALAKTEPVMEQGAYQISPETKKEVGQIEFDVEDAKKEYTTHRLALEELAARVAQGHPVTPKNLREAAKQVRRQAALRKLNHPSTKKQPSSEKSDREEAGNDNPQSTEHETAVGDTSSLLHQMERQESGVREDFSDTTLGRDTVRERDEPPRRRPAR